MTVEAKTHDNNCPKCGSIMQYRRVKITSDELRTILQCVACKFYLDESMD